MVKHEIWNLDESNGLFVKLRNSTFVDESKKPDLIAPSLLSTTWLQYKYKREEGPEGTIKLLETRAAIEIRFCLIAIDLDDYARVAKRGTTTARSRGTLGKKR